MGNTTVSTGAETLNILQEVKFIRERFDYADRTFLFDRVENLDDLVNLVSDDEFNLDERLPYWAELWPSAIGLCRYLLKNNELITGKTVLELGCGQGLTSMALAVAEPARLLISDYEQDALHLARRNFDLNGLKPPEKILLDWRKSELDERFQRIVASDILYEERFFLPLLGLFDRLLAQGGLIVLAEPNRNIARRFFEMLRQNGYRYDYSDQMVEQGQSTIRVSIYLIQKDQNG